MPEIAHLKKACFLIVLVLAFLLIGCENALNRTRPINPGPPATERSFISRNVITSQSRMIETELEAENSETLIYVENGYTITEVILEAILNEFSSQILPVVRSTFGPVSDLDGNGKVILLIYDIERPADPLASFVSGYFSPNDLLRNSRSNNAEILYLDIDRVLEQMRRADDAPGLEPIEIFYGTVVHELQHLANYWEHNSTRTVGSSVRLTETWLDEGLSLAAEEVYMARRNDRKLIPYFGSIEIRDGNSFLTWDQAEAIDYYSVYLFFHWLRLQSDDTDIYLSSASRSVYSDIFDSGYGNYRAITSLTGISDYSALSALRGSTDTEAKIWEKILAHWFAATVVQRPQGLLGFENFGYQFTDPCTGSRYIVREGIVKNVTTGSIAQQSLSPGGRIIAVRANFTTPVTMIGAPPDDLALYGLNISQVYHNNNSDRIVVCLEPEDTGLVPITDSAVAAGADILIAFNSQTSPRGSNVRTGIFTSAASSPTGARSASGTGPETSPETLFGIAEDSQFLEEDISHPLGINIIMPIENE